MTADATTFRAALGESLNAWGLSISPEQMRQLVDHYRSLVVANQSVNLTRITEPRDAAVKHYADSLALWSLLVRRRMTVRSMLDVGTGAGFPAVPMAVALPELAVTAIDGTGKKIDFLQRAAKAGGIDNLTARHARAEHWPPDQPFDLVAVRAVALLATCLKTVDRHVAGGGWLVAYKAAPLRADELHGGERAADKLGYTREEPFRYALTLDSTTLDRALCVYRKA